MKYIKYVLYLCIATGIGAFIGYAVKKQQDVKASSEPSENEITLQQKNDSLISDNEELKAELEALKNQNNDLKQSPKEKSKKTIKALDGKVQKIIEHSPTLLLVVFAYGWIWSWFCLTLLIVWLYSMNDGVTDVTGEDGIEVNNQDVESKNAITFQQRTIKTGDNCTKGQVLKVGDGQWLSAWEYAKLHNEGHFLPKLDPLNFTRPDTYNMNSCYWCVYCLILFATVLFTLFIFVFRDVLIIGPNQIRDYLGKQTKTKQFEFWGGNLWHIGYYEYATICCFFVGLTIPSLLFTTLWYARCWGIDISVTKTSARYCIFVTYYVLLYGVGLLGFFYHFTPVMGGKMRELGVKPALQWLKELKKS